MYERLGEKYKMNQIHIVSLFIGYVSDSFWYIHTNLNVTDFITISRLVLNLYYIGRLKRFGVD